MSEDLQADPWLRRAGLDPASRRRLDRVQRMAKVLDSQFRVPGTSRTFGVDALLGLVPGVGAGAGLVASVALIVQAVLAGARVPTVARMLLIATGDALVGAVPVVGTLADFVIKANQRNARIVTSQALQPDRTTEESRRVVVTTLLVAAGLLVAVVLVAVLAVVLLVRAL